MTLNAQERAYRRMEATAARLRQEAVLLALESDKAGAPSRAGQLYEIAQSARAAQERLANLRADTKELITLAAGRRSPEAA